MENENAREYVAFISYRHKELDKKIAKQVHSMVERYVIPKEMRDEKGTKKLGNVFRDEEELPVSSNLTESIQTALDHSKFLIVICTPNTPESVWVQREIEYFLSHHDRDHVVGILVDGTPDTSFPEQLTKSQEISESGEVTIKEIEPLAANLTNEQHQYTPSRMKKEAVRLYAALLGCPFDSLWQRERRQKMRKLVAVMALGMTVALAFCVSIYLKNLEINARNKQIEEQNEQIQAQNQEITSQNEEIKNQYQQIEERNAQLRKSEAYTLLREGELLYERGDVSGAADRAMQAVDFEEGLKSYGAEAEYLLSRALGAGRRENLMRTVRVIEQEDDVAELLLSDDGTLLYTLGSQGYVRCYSTEDGSLIWKGDGFSRSYHYYVAERQRLHVLKEQGLLLCCNEEVIVALSLKDGSLVWRRDVDDYMSTDFACLSPNEETLAIIDGEGDYFDWTSRLEILDSKTGVSIKTIALPEELSGLSLEASGRQNGAFSEDGRYLAMMLYGGVGWSRYNESYLLLADLQEENVKILKKSELDYLFGIPFSIGMICHGDLQSILVMHYDVVGQCVSMEQVFFDGKVGEHSEVSMALPDREMGKQYHSTFVLGDNNGILASCEEMTFLYTQDEGVLVNSEKYSAGNVLKAYWIDSDQISYAFLSDDGTQYAYAARAWLSLAEYSDRIHLSKLAISDGYVTGGQNGYSFNGDAISAVCCDSEKGKIYLQRPAFDREVKAADWIGASETEAEDYVLCDLEGDPGAMYLLDRKDDEVHLLILDAETRKVRKTWNVNLERTAGVNSTMQALEQGLVWPDGEHVTCVIGYGDCVILNLTDMSEITTYANWRPVAQEQCLTEAGSVVHAALGRDTNGFFTDQSYALLIRVGDGELREIPMEKDDQWIYESENYLEGFLRVGGNGYVVAAQYAGQDSNVVKAYKAWNAWNDTCVTIPRDVPAGDDLPVALGEKTPTLAIADQGGVIKFYDLEKGELKKQIELRAGVTTDKLAFFGGDAYLAAWTTERRLLIYDVSSGELLFEGTFESDDSSTGAKMRLNVIEDPARNRVFFQLNKDCTICVDVRYWKKTADFKGMDAFCEKTNEIYQFVDGSGAWATTGTLFTCRPAYTLEALIEKAR